MKPGFQQSPPPSVYVIDPDPAVRDSLGGLLGLMGLPVLGLDSAQSFRRHWPIRPPFAVLCAGALRDSRGIALYEWIKHRAEGFAFALTLSRHEHRLQQEASRAGIEHIFFKPLLQTGAIEQFIATSLAHQEIPYR